MYRRDVDIGAWISTRHETANARYNYTDDDLGSMEDLDGYDMANLMSELPK